ncbi:uncharacterized protein MONBRDRAFT_33310 [Monosiga brevicollis MX1]|uniref:SUEL-type lectin domain-containing protein n=1 Tax=Monosiga brevicollis TaxID=81824 RepID=A9V4N3_MONBE|nr:uncharacterized protein MONBRDRAFT_33310 [Monosiga brevicollis MX1]EDQ87485.1 predicted protein [Monosiga brevicollis MX1]|eukprot:XP_001747745.1 hypothetical protein [Monosiga brevicollis MX1]
MAQGFRGLFALLALTVCSARAVVEIDAAKVTLCHHNDPFMGVTAVSTNTCLQAGTLYVKPVCGSNARITTYSDAACTTEVTSTTDFSTCVADAFYFECGRAPASTVATMLLYETTDCSSNPPARMWMSSDCKASGPSSSFQFACESDDVKVLTYSTNTCDGSSQKIALRSNECLEFEDIIDSGDDDGANNVLGYTYAHLKCGADNTLDGSGAALWSPTSWPLLLTIAALIVAALH